MEPVNFDSLFSAAEERERWSSSPAQKRRGGTSDLLQPGHQGHQGHRDHEDHHERQDQKRRCGTGNYEHPTSTPGSQRRSGNGKTSSDLPLVQNPGSDLPLGKNHGSDLQKPGSGFQQSRSMPSGDLRHQAIANNINSRISPSKRGVRSLRPDSTPQLNRRTSSASRAGIRRSSSMRDCTEWTRIQNMQKVIIR